MMCQRCGKACANRTEGRRVTLAGKDLFFCNICSSLHAAARSEGGDGDSIRGAPGAAPKTGELAVPPFGG
jgi:hypothetical protein